MSKEIKKCPKCGENTLAVWHSCQIEGGEIVEEVGCDCSNCYYSEYECLQ